MSISTFKIGVIFPEILGTYGDGGNAIILRYRAQKRGYPAEIIPISMDEKIPGGLDIYTLGGGEDSAQTLAIQQIKSSQGFIDSINAGVPLLAICAGMQILGQWYIDATGRQVTGVEFLDCVTEPQGKRSIGEVVSMPLVTGLANLLTGFENHGGKTILGTDAEPLGKVVAGSGNACPNEIGIKYEGIIQGSIIGTYMHGPALARNPELADLLLSKALGVEITDLSAIDFPEIEILRQERIAYSKRPESHSDNA